MEHRVAELQTSVDTLTAQRDAIYDKIQSLRAMRKAVPVDCSNPRRRRGANPSGAGVARQPAPERYPAPRPVRRFA